MFYETHEISRFSSTIILIILIHEKGKKIKVFCIKASSEMTLARKLEEHLFLDVEIYPATFYFWMLKYIRRLLRGFQLLKLE